MTHTDKHANKTSYVNALNVNFHAQAQAFSTKLWLFADGHAYDTDGKMHFRWAQAHANLLREHYRVPMAYKELTTDEEQPLRVHLIKHGMIRINHDRRKNSLTVEGCAHSFTPAAMDFLRRMVVAHPDDIVSVTLNSFNEAVSEYRGRFLNLIGKQTPADRTDAWKKVMQPEYQGPESPQPSSPNLHPSKAPQPSSPRQASRSLNGQQKIQPEPPINSAESTGTRPRKRGRIQSKNCASQYKDERIQLTLNDTTKVVAKWSYVSSIEVSAEILEPPFLAGTKLLSSHISYFALSVTPWYYEDDKITGRAYTSMQHAAERTFKLWAECLDKKNPLKALLEAAREQTTKTPGKNGLEKMKAHFIRNIEQSGLDTKDLSISDFDNVFTWLINDQL